MSSNGDKLRAVIEWHDLNPRRQAAIVIQFPNGILDLGDHVGGFLSPPHNDNCADHIVLVVTAQNTKSRPITDLHLPDVLHEYRNAVDLVQYHIFDVTDVKTLREVIGPTIVDQTHAANVDRLLSDANLAPAHIEVGIAKGRQHLWH